MSSIHVDLSTADISKTEQLFQKYSKRTKRNTGHKKAVINCSFCVQCIHIYGS